MSIETITLTTLQCDAKACRETVEVEGNLEAVWAVAEAKGWGYDDDGHDWCSWHTDPERRPT